MTWASSNLAMVSIVDAGRLLAPEVEEGAPFGTVHSAAKWPGRPHRRQVKVLPRALVS